jgi:hypothetical protein
LLRDAATSKSLPGASIEYTGWASIGTTAAIAKVNDANLAGR